MAQSRMIGGVYHPRAKGGAMSDALADAKRAVNRLSRILVLRGAGLALVLGAAAALVALLSYSSSDASLNNANVRDVANWLGPLGAVAADLQLQIFGIAAIAFLAPLFVWGARALRGKAVETRDVAPGGLAAGHHHGCGWSWPVPTIRQPAGRAMAA